MSLYIDGTVGTCRTQVLTGTAADAALHIDDRDVARAGIALVGGYHLDSSRGAMTLAVAAVDIIGEYDTVLTNPYGMPHLSR